MYLCCLWILSLIYVGQASKCLSKNTFYESMGCIANYSDNSNPCPTKYDCSNVKKSNENQCFFYGKYFDSGYNDIQESLEDCWVGCMCRKARISCADLDCPQHHDPLPKGCTSAYEWDCCPVKTVCESDENIARCTINNKTYLEGEKFDPDPCTSCVCGKGFDGKLEQPYCRKRNCTSDERYYQAIQRNCAPIYLENECCPPIFACGDANEIIDNSKPDIDDTCKFGNKVFSVGDTLQVNKSVVASCKCVTPPLLSCFSNVTIFRLYNLELIPNYY